MIINNASQLEALFVSFVAKYQDIYQQIPTFLDDLATTTTTTTETVRFPWMGRLPTVREWVGDRQVNSAALKFYDVVPKLFETTFGLNKSKIDDDQWGFFSSHILPQMAMQAKKWPDYRLVSTILGNGTWADGKAFFATDHPLNVDNPAITGFDGNNYYSNRHTSTPLTLNNYASIRQKMMARCGEDGKSLNIVPNLLVYPPSLEQTARHILESPLIAPATFGNETSQVGNVNNLYKGSAQGLMIPDFEAESGNWYLMDTTKPIKPFLWVLRESFSFAQRVSPTDPVVFDRNEYLFGGRGRGEAGFGFPFLADKCEA